jgi:hypothetical protein
MTHFCVLVVGQDPAKELAPFQENNMGTCPPEYLAWNADADGDETHPVTGAPGYWENAYDKWDGYEVGGRYADRLRTKGSTKPVDHARWGNIDWDLTKAQRRSAAVEAWTEAKRCSPSMQECFYGILPSTTRKEYLARADRGPPLTCFAFLKNGQWTDRNDFEKNCTGFDDFLVEALTSIHPDAMIWVIDCHI